MKTTSAHSIAGFWKAPMLPERVLNPAVDTVVNIWQTASYRFIPRSLSVTTHTPDRPRYSRIKPHALLWIRLWSNSAECPDDSPEKRILAPAPSEESMTTKKTTTPKPPIHWLMHLQNIRLYGNASRFVKTEAPVVVRPEADSKRASTKRHSGRIKKYGNAPTTVANSQLTPITQKASLW